MFTHPDALRGGVRILRANQVRALIIEDGRVECERIIARATQKCELKLAKAGQSATEHPPRLAVPATG